MGLTQTEKCTLLSIGNPTAKGALLALLLSHPHLDGAISLPSPEFPPCQGSPKDRLGIATLPQPAGVAWWGL